MRDIKVIGYYGHDNIGDEQYKITFQELIGQPIDIIDCDTLSSTNFSDTDIIILGGGDVLSNYFIDKITQKFKGKPNKILAVSVGIPYTDILYTNKLQILDYIFIRTRQDLELLQGFFDKERIFYLPDISYFLKGNYKENYRTKTIGLCLSRHIYKNNQNYTDIIKAFSQFIMYLSHFGFNFILIPFNTSKVLHTQNDILIHTDLYNTLPSHVQSKVTNVGEKLSASQILDIFKSLYMVIPMRFHACLFASYTNTPFLPVFTTRKVLNFLMDINWYHGYKLDTDKNDLPVNLDGSILINRFRNVVALYSVLEEKLKNIVVNRRSETIVQGLLRGDIEYRKNNVCKRNIIKDTLNKLEEYSARQGIQDFRKLPENFHDIAVSLVSYHLTGKIDSIYNYGLKEKMFKDNYNYNAEWSWVLKNERSLKGNKIIYSNPKGLFNLNIQKDQNDYSGIHRSGWQYVFKNLQKYHNENSDLYLDLYIDKTFHWNKEINKELGIIPYTQKWIGFIHHTFDTEFSQYNTTELLKNELFVESLKTCKSLFVLSKYLQNRLEEELVKINCNVKVYSIVHPTETDVPLFEYTKFIENPEKKIVNIGGWLRNIYSYYKVSIPRTIPLQFPRCLIRKTFTLKKCVLKGSHMNNYFPEKDFLEKLKIFLSCNCKQGCSYNKPCISRNPKENFCSSREPGVSHDPSFNKMNNWYKHMYVDISKSIDSVSILEHMSDIDYDKLLTQNIVFLNLCDSSAVNTLIECIVRNTPIIINKIPAVVELLGEKYPLYYNVESLECDISNILSDSTSIRKATEYLSKLNKKIYYIDTFIDNFNKYLLQL